MSEEIYKPKERNIFRYWAGETRKGWINTVKVMREEDPIVVYKRFLEVQPLLQVDMQLAASPSKDSLLGYNRAIDNIKQIFQVKELAEGGLTQPEMFALLDQFLDYCHVVKKNLPVLPMRAKAISTPIDTTAASGESPTNATSASGLTANGVSTAKPEPSLSEPVSL